MLRSIIILGAIGWTTPLMFGGLAMLTLPFIAHLLNRRARRRLVFPSIMLLRESSASQTRLFKLRRWLLLMLRALAVALVVMAFARPLWLDGWSKPVGDQEAVAVVIVADISASMNRHVNEVSGMQALKAAASRALDDLSPGLDSANLVLANAYPGAMFPAMTRNLPALRAEIQSLEPTSERADLVGAMHLAGRLLAEFQGRRRLIVLSDMQSSNWRSVMDAGSMALTKDTQVTVVDVLADPTANLAISNARVEPAISSRHHPAHITATIYNYSDRARIVQASLRQGRREAGSQSLEVPAWAGRDVGFELTFADLGDQSVSVSIGEDAMNADNTAYLVVPVVPRARVLVVGDDAPQSPGTASYFVIRALSPHGDQRDRIEAVHVNSANLTAGELRGAASVFVTDLAAIPKLTMDMLHDYLRGGGGAAIFAGEGEVAGNFNPWLKTAGALPDLPWQFVNQRKLDAEGNVLYLDQIDWSHAMFRDFAPRTHDVWQHIAFRRVWSVAQSPHSQARVIMRFADGSPAVAVQPLGLGRLIVANFSPSLTCGDLGKYGAFVALAQSMNRYMAGRWTPWQFAMAGQSLSMPVTVDAASAVSELTVADPAGQPMRCVVSMPSAHEAVVSVSRAATPGIYEARRSGQAVAMAAVNVDERESDLRAIPSLRVAEALNQAGLEVTGSDMRADAPPLALRGRPLWGWALLAALCSVAMEMLLLAYWRR